MTQADIKIAAYQECIDIAEAVVREFGPMPGVAARVIAARIQSLLRQVASEA